MSIETFNHQETPVITVVLPTYNRCQWLRRAVASVLSETRVPIRLHIFDNASTDDTQEYVLTVATTDQRVSYTRNPQNLGAIQNFVNGLGSIQTEYFVPLSDDDWLLPDFLFDAYHEILKNKELGAVILATSIETENGEVVGTYPDQLEKRTFGLLTPKVHVRDWMQYGHYAWSSILWRKNVLDYLGHPYFHVGLPSDVDFQLQVFCRFPVFFINRLGAVYFLHKNQGSGAPSISNLFSWESIFRRLDHAVRRENLFDRNEYSALRKLIQDRYQGVWNYPHTSPLEERRSLSSAVSAGFRLGDWKLAFDLLDRFVAAGAYGKKNEDIQGFVLPENAAVMEPLSVDYISKVSGFLPSIIAWFKLTNERLRTSEESLQSLNSANQELKAKLTEHLRESNEQIIAERSAKLELESLVASLNHQQTELQSRIEHLSSSLGKWQTKARTIEKEKKKVKEKLTSIRAKLKNQSSKSLGQRVRTWWKKVRGKGTNTSR